MLPIDAIHPNPRAHASPSGGIHVRCNPPSLLWPAGETGVHYTVRLSRSDRFPGTRTTTEAGIPWAVFTPGRELEPGLWYWQVGRTGRGATAWSETFTFEMPADARKTGIPPAGKVLDRARRMRPRLMPDPARDRSRRSRKTRDLAERLYRQTGHLLGRDLPDDTAPPDKGEDDYKRMKFARWSSKRLAAGEVAAIEHLVVAARLIRDDRYTDEAIRTAVNVAAWDPDGFTHPEISDFADASCMRAMALVYDTAFDRLSGEDRHRLRDAMVVRCRRFYEGAVNDVETRLFGGHLWQHLLTEFFEASLALLGEVPEAHAWCRYIYELWIARFPLIAGDDGGWANGPNYFGTNVETLILMSDYFGRLGAPGFDEAPWFRNASKFLRYVWPPGSENDGFGDGTELDTQPGPLHRHWMEHLGHRFRDRQALDWANAWNRIAPAGPVDPRLALLSLDWDPVRPGRPRRDPKARLFRDTGLVSAHTDRERIGRNLNVAFRSSPFGSFNHMHCCQNAFNLFYAGQRLFANSGYYVAMADEHAKNWYRATRGHNTVVVDGQGQTRSPEGFGWIPRFIDGACVTYWAGDASNAYGESGLTRYRRHVALLHPDIVVVYDDLAADHAAEWTWQLHAPNRLTWNGRKRRFATRSPKTAAHLTITASAACTVELGDTLDPPPVNWGGKPYRGRTPDVFPNQWHASLTTEAAQTARFLSVVTVGAKPLQVRPAADGGVRVGRWKVSAVVDPDEPAALTVTRSREPVALVVDTPAFAFDGADYRARDASVLVEGGRARRSRDRLPAAARYLE